MGKFKSKWQKNLKINVRFICKWKQHRATKRQNNNLIAAEQQKTVKLSEAPVRLGLREWRLDKHQG